MGSMLFFGVILYYRSYTKLSAKKLVFVFVFVFDLSYVSIMSSEWGGVYDVLLLFTLYSLECQ